MIAVTIGIGGLYRESAAVAANCLHRHTGLDTVLLTEHDFRASGLKHPAAMKLMLFDLVDAEDVLYYDADWFCVSPWNPQQLASRSNLIACRDFIALSDWPEQRCDGERETFSGRHGTPFVSRAEERLRHDYIAEIREFNGLRLPPNDWINTGLFIANRTHHAAIFQEALKIYRGRNGHHEKYYEQPAIQKAMDKLAARADLLPRKYNVLASSWQRWPSSTVGVHVKLSKSVLFRRLIEMLEHGELTYGHVKDFFVCPRLANGHSETLV